MRNLILVDGAFGVGKKMLAQYINSAQTGLCELVTKKTHTSDGRVVEAQISVDLVQVELSDDFAAMWESKSYFRYRIDDDQSVQRYVISKESVRTSIDTHVNTFVVIRDQKCAKELVDKYQGDVNVILVFLHCDGNSTEGLMCSDSFKVRSHSRSDAAWGDFLKKNTGLEYHLLTYRIDAGQSEFRDSLQRVLDRNRVPLRYPSSIVGRAAKIDRVLRERPFHKNVFVMMNFSDGALIENIVGRLAKFQLSGACASQPPWKDVVNSNANPIALAYMCKYGLAILKGNAERDLNVTYEIGLINALDRTLIAFDFADPGERGASHFAYSLLTQTPEKVENPVDLLSRIEDWSKRILTNGLVMLDLSLRDGTQKRIIEELRITQELLCELSTKLSGRDRGVEIVALPDLGMPNNVTRICGGFYTGALYKWEADVPFVPIDTTVNVDTVTLFELHGGFSNRAEFDFCDQEGDFWIVAVVHTYGILELEIILLLMANSKCSPRKRQDLV